MDLSLFGAKELYEVTLRATEPFMLGGRMIEKGEPITTFERIQYGTVLEQKNLIEARGGYKNQIHITWTDSHAIRFNFTQGVFTYTDLALLSNADLNELTDVEVPEIENGEVGEDLTFTCSHTPIPGSLFIYYTAGLTRGAKVQKEDYILEGKKITFKGAVEKFTDIKLMYNFIHKAPTRLISIGKPMTNTFFELTGKTRLVDDKTGETTTVILKIPRLQVVSNFSVNLGQNVTPLTVSFEAEGYPYGPRGQERVMEVAMLDEDIDRNEE